MQFYFHFRLHGALFEDRLGRQFADIGEAVNYAEVLAIDILRGPARGIGSFRKYTFEITDQTGAVRAVIPLGGTRVG